MSMRPRHVFILLGALVLIILALAMVEIPGRKPGPVISFGGPLRRGNQVYLLTGQRKRAFNSGSDLLVDLWAFDASTTAPLYRRRVETVREGSMYSRKILGAHHRTLWLLLTSGPYAI